MYQDLSKHIHVLYTTGHKDPDPRPHPLGILWYPFFLARMTLWLSISARLPPKSVILTELLPLKSHQVQKSEKYRNIRFYITASVHFHIITFLQWNWQFWDKTWFLKVTFYKRHIRKMQIKFPFSQIQFSYTFLM